MALTLSGKTITVTSVTFESRSKKQMYAIPGGDPLVIDLGYEGPIYQITSSIDATQMAAWRDVAIGTELSCTTSSYVEIPTSGNVYYLDSVNINRKGGTIDKWELKISLIRAATAKIITQV